MFDMELRDMTPGLVKLSFSYRGNPQEELAWKLPSFLADYTLLPNDTLCYRDFLRSGMEAAGSRGLNPIGPFSGREIRDKHIVSVNKRVIQLNLFFADLGRNYSPLLIACNDSSFPNTITELKRTLSAEGFDVDASCWDDYKAWEKERLAKF